MNRTVLYCNVWQEIQVQNFTNIKMHVKLFSAQIRQVICIALPPKKIPFHYRLIWMGRKDRIPLYFSFLDLSQ
jgi:hypothetical protein